MSLGELEKFFVKEVTREVDGVKLKIPQLSTKDLPLVQHIANNDSKAGESLKQLAFKVLKHNYPEITMSDVDKLKLKFIDSVIDALAEANGLK